MHSCSYITIMCIGLLPAVRSLELTIVNSSYSLEWVPPFSLDIPSVDPDIEGYCVNITSLTSSNTLHSQCEITNVSFSYPIPSDDGCHDYMFTVTPVNILGNGTQAVVTLSQGTYWNHLLFCICTIWTSIAPAQFINGILSDSLTEHKIYSLIMVNA